MILVHGYINKSKHIHTAFAFKYGIICLNAKALQIIKLSLEIFQ